MELGRDAFGRRRDPLHQLDDDAVGVLDLEVALAPLFGFDGREDRGAGGGQALVLGVDVVDD
jgi:hypothetical protein